MTRNHGKHPDSEKHPSASKGDGLEQDDALWDLLGKASDRQADSFFARNIVRETRLSSPDRTSAAAKVIQLFTGRKAALAAAACLCALLTYSFWPSPQPASTTASNPDNNPHPEPTSALTELIIEESLEAAAEDPTLFTHDEVVAMIGF